MRPTARGLPAVSLLAVAVAVLVGLAGLPGVPRGAATLPFAARSTPSPFAAAAPAGGPPVAVPGDVGAALARVSVRAMAAAGPRNVLVDAPCNTSGNAEVEQAYDRALDYLYEAWIGCGGIGFARSTDGGFSFQPAVTVPGSRPVNGSSWDPAIALAPNGTVYVAFMAATVDGDTPVVAWSWDHGASFAGWANASVPTLAEFSDRDFIAVAPNGTIDLTWDYSPNASLDYLGCASGGSCFFLAGDYNVVFTRSTDGGRTWSAPVPIDPEYPNGGAVAAPILVTANGTIDVLYEDYNVSGPAHLLGNGTNYFSRSTDGGSTWSPPVPVSNTTFPATVWWIDGDLAEDAGGTLYATYDSLSGGTDTAYVTTSADGGTTWAVPTRINPDVDAAAHALVGVAGGAAGTAYLAWMANNSSRGWSAFEAPLTVTSNGTSLGPISRVSSLYGIPGDWVGDTLGVSWLGGNASAVSWSYGVDLNGTNASQVYAAVLGIAPPGVATSLGAVPGPARLTLDWIAPTGAAAPTGYRIAWSIEGLPAAEEDVGPTPTSADIVGLIAGARYEFTVTAFDAGGLGSPSAPLNVTLTAWEVVVGTVVPASATVTIDSVPVPVVAGTFDVNTTYAAHLLLASARNYAPQMEALATVWNGTEMVSLALSLLGGAVRGTVFPAPSTVTFDGAVVAVIGGDFAVSAPGDTLHTLAASYPGFAPLARNVTVPANATVWVNLTLTPLDAHLDLAVAPSNASVSVNGSAAAFARDGWVNLSLAPGTYPIEVSAPAFDPYFANLTLLPGSWRNLTVALVPASNSTTGPLPGARGSSGPDLLLDPWVLLGIGAAALAVAALALWARRRPPTYRDGSAEDAAGADEPLGDPPMAALPRERADGPR